MEPLQPPKCPICNEDMYLGSQHLEERPELNYVLEITWDCSKRTHRVRIKKKYRVGVEEL